MLPQSTNVKTLLEDLLDGCSPEATSANKDFLKE
jgi:hypothetical protein